MVVGWGAGVGTGVDGDVALTTNGFLIAAGREACLRMGALYVGVGGTLVAGTAVTWAGARVVGP